MATYSPAKNAEPPFSGNFGNRVVFNDSVAVSANIANADKIRIAKVPAGTLVDRVVVKNPDLDSGTTLQFKLGFEGISDSLASDLSAAVAAGGATTWQAAATTTYELLPPVLVDKDAYLVATASAAGVGTGTVYGKVEGEALGAK